MIEGLLAAVWCVLVIALLVWVVWRLNQWGWDEDNSDR